MKEQELPELPEAGYFGYESDYGYTEEQVQAYGAACAAQARELALDEARLLADSTAGLNAQWLVDQIEALKGK